MYHRSNNEYGANAWEVQRARPARPQSAGVAGTRAVGAIGGVATGTAYYQRSSDVYGGFSQTHAAAAHNTRAVSAGIAPPVATGGARTRATGGAGPSTAPVAAPVAAPGVSNPGVNKALIVGINYIGTSCPLGGCVNDAKAALASLQKWGFSPKDAGNFMMLVEEGDKKNWPYKKNIEAGFKWLLQGVKEGDVLWLHFSGHGTQVADKSGDEADGQVPPFFFLTFLNFFFFFFSIIN